MKKKSFQLKSWSAPILIGGAGILFFIFFYVLSSFINPDVKGIGYLIELAFKTFAVAGVVWMLCRTFFMIASLIYNKRTGKPLPRVISSLFNLSVTILGVIFVVVVVFGKPAWSIIAAGGFIGAAVAIALQNLINDIFSGFVLDMEKNYKYGDWIKLPDGQIGSVDRSSWRSVILNTAEGNTFVASNSALIQHGFQNLSRPEEGFYEQVEIAIDHCVPVARAERLLHSALLSISEIPKDKGFEAFACRSTEGGIIYCMRYYVVTFPRFREIKHRVLEAATRHLHEAGFKVSETIGEYALSRAKELVLTPDLDPLSCLRHIDLFGALTDKEKRLLASNMIRLEIGEGVDVIQEGEKGSSMFVIGEGTVEVLKKIKKERKVSLASLAFLESNQFFGDMALLLGKNRTATVRAKSNCVLFEIQKSALAPILKKRPTVAKTLSEVVARRQQETVQTLAHQKGDKDHRMVANEILKGIRSFFGIS